MSPKPDLHIMGSDSARFAAAIRASEVGASDQMIELGELSEVDAAIESDG